VLDRRIKRWIRIAALLEVMLLMTTVLVHVDGDAAKVRGAIPNRERFGPS
jgi:hypothetical protein